MGKFYLTTAIDYVNGPPHIGHAIQKVWADAIARSHRQRGDQVWFLTGTDEHGVNVVRAAEALGVAPAQLADQNAARFRAMREALDLSWDDFIRTTDRERHWPGVTLLWERLSAAGDIYRKQYRGLYCAGHEAFITQKDLVDGRCILHQKAPEVVDEENYFFRLSRYTRPIQEAIETDALAIVPASRKHEILSVIRDGLEDVSFSRPSKDLPWGIPVPGDQAHTIYVWGDALTNYLSAIGYGRGEGWQRWWPADLHVLGKDNLRFHAAIWPGMLLAAGIPLPKQLFVHGFVTVDGQKISKTVGNVVDPFPLVERYGTDALRYYFLREIPPYDDGDFSIRRFEERYQGDLANGLGNFAARVLTLAEQLSPLELEGVSSEVRIRERIARARATVTAKVDAYRFHEALAAIWDLIGFGDAYVNQEEPWAVAELAAKRTVVGNLVSILEHTGQLLKPFLPGTATAIAHCIERQDNTVAIKKGEVLFPRLNQ